MRAKPCHGQAVQDAYGVNGVRAERPGPPGDWAADSRIRRLRSRTLAGGADLKSYTSCRNLSQELRIESATRIYLPVPLTSEVCAEGAAMDHELGTGTGLRDSP